MTKSELIELMKEIKHSVHEVSDRIASDAKRDIDNGLGKEAVIKMEHALGMADASLIAIKLIGKKIEEMES